MPVCVNAREGVTRSRGSWPINWCARIPLCRAHTTHRNIWDFTGARPAMIQYDCLMWANVSYLQCNVCLWEQSMINSDNRELRGSIAGCFLSYVSAELLSNPPTRIIPWWSINAVRRLKNWEVGRWDCKLRILSSCSKNDWLSGLYPEDGWPPWNWESGRTCEILSDVEPSWDNMRW